MTPPILRTRDREILNDLSAWNRTIVDVGAMFFQDRRDTRDMAHILGISEALAYRALGHAGERRRIALAPVPKREKVDG